MHPLCHQTARDAYPTMAENMLSSYAAWVSSDLPSATLYSSEFALGNMSTVCNACVPESVCLNHGQDSSDWLRELAYALWSLTSVATERSKRFPQNTAAGLHLMNLE